MKKLIAIIVVLGMLLAVAPVSACPMCKEAVPAAGDDNSLTPEDQEAVQQAKAWNASILLFVSMPYMLVGGVGFLVYRSYKKARQA